MRGLNGEETNLIEALHWPLVINIKELYDDHQAQLAADPSMRLFSAARVQYVDTGYTHDGYDDRRPFIVVDGTIYLGNHGAWHSNVIQTLTQSGIEKD